MSTTYSAIRLAETRVRAARYDLNGGLFVSSKTIGSTTSYKLMMSNVSRSGLRLEWDQKYRAPFIENTIIEMTIDPDCKWLKSPVACLGKIVRRVEHSSAMSVKQQIEFGVHIVQIDPEDLTIWEACLSELSNKAEHLFGGDPKVA